MHCFGCLVSRSRHICHSTMIRNVLTPGEWYGYLLTTSTKTVCIKIWWCNLYLSLRSLACIQCGLLSPPHNKNHSSKHYHLYKIKYFLEVYTVCGSSLALWAVQYNVWAMIGYALWKLYLSFFFFYFLTKCGQRMLNI